MKIVNEKVRHITFGEGTVINQEDGRITIQFSKEYGIKLFLYPDAFEKYLVLNNSDMELAAMDELHHKMEQLEAGRIRKLQELEELTKSMILKRTKPTTSKKKSTGKRKTSKQKPNGDILADKKATGEEN